MKVCRRTSQLAHAAKLGASQAELCSKAWQDPVRCAGRCGTDALDHSALTDQAEAKVVSTRTVPQNGFVGGGTYCARTAHAVSATAQSTLLRDQRLL